MEAKAEDEDGCIQQSPSGFGTPLVRGTSWILFKANDLSAEIPRTLQEGRKLHREPYT
jgi:hypothetical protein